MIPDKLRIDHILKSTEQIVDVVSRPKDEVLSVHTNCDSLCYHFILIGEAAASISDAFKAAHPEVPWAVMKQMRNILVHEYMQTNMDIVWDTATKDVPELVRQLTALKASLEQQVLSSI